MAAMTQEARGASLTLRALARLLGYPDAELRQHLPALRESLHLEAALAAERLAELDALLDSLAGQEALDAEADYVQLFDSSRSTALHLFEHVHGDSRERGPAMIDLAQTYEKAGLYLAEGQMPDYLPVVLEFTSTQPPDEARAFLGEMAHLFNAIYNALQKRDSHYASVLGGLMDLAGESIRPVPVVSDEPVDESWTEPAAFEGCSTQGQARASTAQPINFVRRDNGISGAAA